MSTEDVTAEIAAVLAEHEAWEDGEYVLHCACGSKFYPEQRDTRRVHLADALADLLAARDRRVRAEALREAAEDCDRQVLGAPFSLASLGPWLRDRAYQIEADA